jgi:ribosomal protein S8E
VAGRSIGARLRSEQSIWHQSSSHARGSTQDFVLTRLSLVSASRYELGRVPANTKLSANTAVRTVRVRGGNKKFRALRLDTGNFSWGSEVNNRRSDLMQWRLADLVLARLDSSQAVTRKARILDVNYNASNNELVSLNGMVYHSRRLTIMISPSAGPNPDSCQECHHSGRCHALQAMVSDSLWH